MGSVIEKENIEKRDSLDADVLSEIPFFDRPLSIESHGSSAWAHSYRIDVEVEGGIESYFMKISVGDHGREALKGEYESTAAIHNVVGDFAPKPMGWGSFKSLPGAHYYFCRFYALSERLPEPDKFCEKVVELHQKSESPNGKFGFHVVTYNGNLPQKNDFSDSWEQFFTDGFKHMLQLNRDRGGPWDGLDGLEEAMITKVIPRLLRPLETEGRKVKPVLVHGDLWCGNTAVDKTNDLPLIYDPASFYAHNEYELGNWRPARNKFSLAYFKAYHSRIPKSAPAEDYDDRNALYSMRFNLHAAALFPDVPKFREYVIDEMKRLVEKFPGGYENYVTTNSMSTAPSNELPCSFDIRGVSLPAVGLGTFQGDTGNGQVKEAVLKALKCGYRHIDTATAYGNEREVGEAIKESGIPRKSIFVTTKLAQTWHDPGDVEVALADSLTLLQLDYVDLYLMHFPHAYVPGPGNSTLRYPDMKPIIDLELSRDYTSTWAAMETLVEKGRARLIGVSNFNILKLKRLLQTAKIQPAVNQVELHPYLPQSDLIAFCSEKGIHVMAHQPLGGKPVAAVSPNAHRPGPLYNPEISQIASKYQISPAQVILSWLIQLGVSVIPKTVHESRLVENLDVKRLDDSDIEFINTLSKRYGETRYLDPRDHIGFDIFDEENDQPVPVE